MDIPSKHIFKNASGKLRTRDLFVEMARTDAGVVPYTLGPEDIGNPVQHISLYKAYMAADDPYEVTFANTYFYSHPHWVALCNTSWFKPIIAQWRTELDLRKKGEALRTIADVAVDKNAQSSVTAAKYILDKGYVPNPNLKKSGRPSKEAISREAAELHERDREALNDAARLGITLQ